MKCCVDVLVHGIKLRFVSRVSAWLATFACKQHKPGAAHSSIQRDLRPVQPSTV